MALLLFSEVLVNAKVDCMTLEKTICMWERSSWSRKRFVK